MPCSMTSVPRLAGILDQGGDRPVVGEVGGAEGVNAALRRRLGEQEDEYGRQPGTPPRRPDCDRDLGYILTYLFIPGDRHPCPVAVSKATSANRRT